MPKPPPLLPLLSILLLLGCTAQPSPLSSPTPSSTPSPIPATNTSPLTPTPTFTEHPNTTQTVSALLTAASLYHTQTPEPTPTVSDTVDGAESLGILAEDFAWSPDGEWVATLFSNEIFVISIKENNIIQLGNGIRNVWNLSWSPDGKNIIYGDTGRGNNLFIIVNFEKFIQGEPKQENLIFIESSLEELENTGLYAKWSPHGNYIAFIGSDNNLSSHLYALAITTNEMWKLSPLDIDSRYFGFSWSPTEEQIVFTAKGEESDSQLYILDIETLSTISLPSPDFNSYAPEWSPDGSKIVFSSTDGVPIGDTDIYLVNPDGSELQALVSTENDEFSPVWSPNGKYIAYVTLKPNQWPVKPSAEIFVLEIDSGQTWQITNHPDHDFNPQWSPNGTKIAFLSRRGEGGIYIMDISDILP